MAIAGALVMLKLYWLRVKAFFASLFSSKKPVEGETAAEQGRDGQ